LASDGSEYSPTETSGYKTNGTFLTS